MTLTFFGQNVYVSMRLDARDAMVAKLCRYLSSKAIGEKSFLPKKRLSSHFLTSRALPIEDKSILTFYRRISSRATDCFFHGLLPVMVPERMAQIWKKYGISLNLTFDDLW